MFVASTINLLDVKEETSGNEDLENYLQLAQFNDYVKVEDIETEFDKIEGETEKSAQTEASGTNSEVNKQDQNELLVKTEEIEIKSEEDEQERVLKDWADEMESLMEQKPSNESQTVKMEFRSKLKHKVLNGQSRELISLVLNFMKREADAGTPIIPLSKVQERVSAATGVSIRTIRTISKESDCIKKGEKNCFLTPNKKRTPKKRKTN